MANATPSIAAVEWSKFAILVSGMTLAVLTRLETYKYLQAPSLASVATSMFDEMAQMATARAIVLEDVAFFAAKTLSQLSFEERVVHMRQQGDRFASQAPTHKVSTLQDLEQGKRLEVEETLGYAVRQGVERGVPTPTLDTCYKLIAGINRYLQ